MEIIGPLVQFQNQLQIFHWQSRTYAQHKAFGHAYKSISGLIDTFVETYLGIFGNQESTIQFSFTLKNLSTDNINNALDDFLDFLDDITRTFVKNTDLINIKDTMLGDINQLKYLLTLK